MIEYYPLSILKLSINKKSNPAQLVKSGTAITFELKGLTSR